MTSACFPGVSVPTFEAMGIDETRHDNRVGSIHHFGVTGAKPLTNLCHPAVFDEDVGFDEVWGLRPQGENGASLRESCWP